MGGIRRRAGDSALVRRDLRAAADAIRLARRALGTIRSNLFRVLVRHVAATEELTGAGRERFDMALLPLDENRVECRARFPRPGHSCANDEHSPIGV
ncbi:hypothetical protein STRIP9103_00640 [Streptomyces ipomoeae 91-03]|uniref:Uncharacterized protein n=1 Tax=Streptomyces ipomoeae 91-03 TaxID=698759 RepID=L1L0Q7_9ACTN|nr:hypothetical protein STRIP9103_00640 [Streptomyces ipomoeae 91-03]